FVYVFCISVFCFFFFFFFSSRRRHTRSYGDWSSDVCSSDLAMPITISCTPVPPARWMSSSMHGITLSPPSREKRFCPTYFVCRRSEERRVGKECRSRWWADH